MHVCFKFKFKSEDLLGFLHRILLITNINKIFTKFKGLTLSTQSLVPICKPICKHFPTSDIWCSLHEGGTLKAETKTTRDFFKEKLIIFFLSFTHELFNQFFFFSIKWALLSMNSLQLKMMKFLRMYSFKPKKRLQLNLMSMRKET